MRNQLLHVRAPALTREEQIAFSFHLLTQPLHFRVAAGLQLHAGLRIGEAIAARWNWLEPNPEDCTVILIPMYASKTHQPRTIPLSSPLKELLRLAWKQTRETNPNPDLNITHIVAKPNRPRFTTRWANKKISTLCAKNGLRHFHTHCLRHTFATNLLHVTNLRIVQILMGHAGLGTTQLYLHPDLDTLRTAVNIAAEYPYHPTTTTQTAELPPTAP